LLARDHTPAFSTHTAVQLDILLVEVANPPGQVGIKPVIILQVVLCGVAKLERPKILKTESESVMLEKQIVRPPKTFRAIFKVQLD
jgi:hypothetical protein